MEWPGQSAARREASDLSPGRALDIGSGEGADARWLAERGWQVTALDVSRVALDRGAAHAARAGAEIARRIDWLHADLLDWSPDAAAYDLVTAQFMHLPPAPRKVLFSRFAALVAPDGSLLVVGHHPLDLQIPGLRHQFPELLFTATDVAALLDPDEWKVLVADTRRRTVQLQDQAVTAHDAVLRAQRLA